MDIALIMRALSHIIQMLNGDPELRLELMARAAEIEAKTKLLAEAIMKEAK